MKKHPTGTPAFGLSYSSSEKYLTELLLVLFFIVSGRR